MDLDLTRSDLRKVAHLFVEEDYNKHKELGWAWFCAHLDDWRPTVDVWGGDNLVSFFEWIAIKLQRAR